MNGEYELEPVKELGPGGWITATKHVADSPGNWSDAAVTALLDVAFASLTESIADLNLKSRVIRKKRAVGLIPASDCSMSREALDECVLRVQAALYDHTGDCGSLPYCAFNGGRDVWVDVGNKRVGVSILQTFLGVPADQTLHVGDQFLNTGNDYAARSCAPCAWITSPEETTYILKKMLDFGSSGKILISQLLSPKGRGASTPSAAEMHRRASQDGSESEGGDVKKVFDPYTGDMVPDKKRSKR